MMTSSNWNIFRVTGHLCVEFTGPRWIPAQRPVTRSFDVFFDLRLNKRLSKQPWGWWFETPAWSLWRHRNGDVLHDSDLKMDTMASQITGVSIVCSGVCSSADQVKHQSSASLAVVRGIIGHRWIPLTEDQWHKTSPFDDVIMCCTINHFEHLSTTFY